MVLVRIFITAYLPIVSARKILDCSILFHEYLFPATASVWYCCDPNVVPGNIESEDWI